MLAAHCPHCGAPVAVSLATPDTLACGTCGTQSPTPPRERAEINKAAEILGAMDERSRQLSASARKAIASSRSSMLYFGLALGLGAVPVLIWTLLALVSTIAEGRPVWEALWLVFTLVPLVVLGALGTVWLRSRKRKLEDACAARPPLRPNEPAGCAVCGAPLPNSTDALVRCTYCQADNLVDPAVLERSKKNQSMAFDNYAQALQLRAQGISSAAGVASGVAVGVGCASPAVAIVLLVITTVVLFVFVREPADAKAEYVAVPHGKTACLAELNRKEDGSATLDFQGNEPEGMKSYREIPSLKGYRVFDAKSLVGVKVRDSNGTAGKVEKVQSTPVLLDSVVVVLDSGKRDEWAIPGLCLVH